MINSIRKTIFLIKLILIIFLLTLWIIICLKIFNFNFNNYFFEKLEKIFIYKNNEIYFFINYSLIFTISYHIMLPLNYVYTIFAAYIINNLMISIIYNFLCIFINSILYFYFYTKFIKFEYIEELKEKYPIIYKLYNQFLNNQLKVSLIIRFLFLPSSYKEFFLILIKIKFKNYLISSFIFYLIFSIQNTLIGYEIKNYNKLWNNYFSKIILLFIIFLIWLNLGIGIYLGFYIKNLKNKKKLELNLEE